MKRTTALQQKCMIATCLILLGFQGDAQDDAFGKAKLLYENSLSREKCVRNWIMEGPGKTEFNDGWMRMYSPGEEWHHVFWCEETFPPQFVAEWEVQNLNPEAGLLIIFFAATGEKGRDIVDPSLPPRDGTFRHYTRGKLNNYHISYYAHNPKNPDRQFAHLRKNSGFNLVQTGPEGIAKRSTAIHKLRLIKKGGRVRFYIDDRKVIDWQDDGITHGPVHGAGRIGFRQMQWSDFRYRNFKVWSLEGS